MLRTKRSCRINRSTSAGLLTIILALGIAAAPSSAQSFRVIYNFTGSLDGAEPLDGLTIDQAGNLYGTASAGGNQVAGCSNGNGVTGCGSVFKLAHAGSGWVLYPLYDFVGGSGGSNPGQNVVFGPDGALYGTTPNGVNCTPPIAEWFMLSGRQPGPVPLFCAAGRRRCFTSSPAHRMGWIPPAV